VAVNSGGGGGGLLLRLLMWLLVRWHGRCIVLLQSDARLPLMLLLLLVREHAAGFIAGVS
jgi:hypothetical protein